MNKDNFLMYSKWGIMFKSLPDDKAGQLIKAIFEVRENPDYEIDDPVLSAIFEMIKEYISENEAKYKEKCEKLAANAKQKKLTSKEKPARKSKSKQLQTNDNNSEQIESDASLSLSLNTNTNNISKNDNTNTSEKSIKHKHGEYKHVLLTEQEYQRLLEEYGEQGVSDGIKNVDEYCQEHGKSYKDYNLVLRKWGIKSPKIVKPKEVTKPPDNRIPYDPEDFDIKPIMRERGCLIKDGYWIDKNGNWLTEDST